MTAFFRISEQDHSDAARLFAKPTLRSCGIAACVLAALALVAAFGTGTVRGFGVGGLIGGLGMCALLRWVISPITLRRYYGKYKTIQQEFGVLLLESGVQFSSPTGQHLLIWEHIMKWRHNDQFVLLCPSARIYHIVPKAVADQGFDVNLLMQQLRRRIGPPV